MTDRSVRQWATVSTALACVAVALDAPSLVRVPVVVAFAMVAPGIAITRFIPTLTGVDRTSAAVAISLSLNITVSMILVAAGRWNGEPVLVTLAALTLGCTFIPLRSPWSERCAESARLHNEQIRDRRRAQDAAYEQVVSADPGERRQGLIALSWLLDDDHRRAEAARLRTLSRLDVPPRLPLVEPQTPAENKLRDAHERARSEDPETRRRGLFEVAAYLDTDHAREAETLRGLAASDEVPEPR